MIKADLHLHSRFSDGSDSAEEAIRKCVEKGIEVVSLVDHDMAPNEKLLQEITDRYQVEIIMGMECGTRDEDTRQEAHILAYEVKDYAPVEKLMKPVLEMRHECSLWQIKQLRQLGYDITEEEVAKETDSPYIYRQHINYVLYKKGLIDDMFGSWMHRMYRGKGALRVEYQYPDTSEVIKAIVKGGGRAVIAHPGQQQNLRLVAKLVDAGLSGLELIHPSNTPFDLGNIVEMAQEYHLFLTGGSDSHGVLSSKGGTIGEYVMKYKTADEIFKIR